jgi:hypothetical protein
VIEGSNNGSSWMKLCDRRNERSAQIDAKSMIAASDYFQLVRFHQTERNQAGGYGLAVSFFGVVGGLWFMRRIPLAHLAILIGT